MASPRTDDYRRDYSRTFRATCAVATAIAIAAIVSLAGCAKETNSPMMAGPAAVPVLTAKAVRKSVPNQLHEIGRVEAYSVVNIKSRVEGELIAIHFREGDFVRKGQLLFNLDPRPFQAALDEAEANLAKEKAQATQAITDETRYAYLLKEGVGSREQYDQSHATAAALRASIVADRAAIQTARLNLQYTRITSPIDGHTGNLQSHIGDLIKADSDNPMVTIAQVEPIYVDFSLPEKDLGDVRRNMRTRQLEVDAAIPNSQAEPEHGILSFVDNTVDKTTGTILLKGLFQNENLRLWPGQFVNATLTLNTIPGAILIPTQAIQTGQNGQFVFVVSHDMTAQPRQVALGESIGRDTIIEHGVDAGETVVTDGQLRLAPGSKVELRTSL